MSREEVNTTARVKSDASMQPSLNDPRSAGGSAFYVAGVLALALVLRIAAIGLLDPIDPLKGDAREYFTQSLRLVSGESYTWNRAPGYAALLAAAQRPIMGASQDLTDDKLTRSELAPDHPAYAEQQARLRIGQALNVGLALLGILGVYLVGRSLHGPTLGVLAALFVAVDPRYVTHVYYPIVDNAHWPMVVWSMVTLIWCLNSPSAASGLLAGFAAGATALVRSIGLYFTPVAALLVLLLGGRGLRRNGAAALAMIAAQGFVILPWTLRNYFHLDRLVIVSYDDGNPILMGNTSNRQRQAITADVKEKVKAGLGDAATDEQIRVDMNAELKQRGLQIIRDRQPAWLLQKVVEVGPRILRPGGWLLSRGGDDPELFGDWGVRAIAAILVTSGLAVLALGGVGFALCRLGRSDLLLLLFVLYLALVHIATHFGPIRFQLSFFWILLLYAAALFVARAPWSLARVAGIAIWLGLLTAAQISELAPGEDRSSANANEDSVQRDGATPDVRRAEPADGDPSRMAPPQKRDRDMKEPKRSARRDPERRRRDGTDSSEQTSPRTKKSRKQRKDMP